MFVEVLYRRCAGVDVSKRDAKVCVRIQGSGRRATAKTVTRWGSTTREILALRDHLLAERVSLVVIESTSTYWKPFFYLLEDALSVVLVNAGDVKSVPGRKTDVSDAEWLADLGAHGLVRASFVPPPPLRELRDLTRLRASIVADRGQEVQRLEKLLEDAQIKLSSVVSDLLGASSRAILTAMVHGQTDPEALAQLARGRLTAKHDQLVEALTGRFTPHHGFLVGLHLDRIDAHTQNVQALEERIEQAMAPFQAARQLLTSIPGIHHNLASAIIAEIGIDMSVFPTAGHLCSWAGTSPGVHESAGHRKPMPTRAGNRHLTGALGIAALNIARSPSTYLGVKYRRLAARRGKKRALVAIQRSLLVIIWNMLITGEVYHDPGPDYYRRRDPQQRIRRAVRDLLAVGVEVPIPQLARTG